ncbi:MAG: DUF3014 domain-containing protein [Gammaproteobacteria bacterium HGW-Gammaproteobacteria-3]|nr:MAG: DUF3014 domain-containing protein [Gammaproteobacteria bacterium HGW-Gammaproteobacteria-3]
MKRYDLTERKRPWGTIFILLLVMATFGVGAWLYYKPQKPDETGSKTQELPVPKISKEPIVQKDTLSENKASLSTQDESAASTTPLAPTDARPLILPALESSDSLFRTKMTELSPELAPWLNTDALIRKTLVIVNDFAQGQRLYQHMQSFKLSEPFAAKQDEQGLYITSKSYQRYNALTQALDAINVQSALAFYKAIKPLSEQVFAGFNYPEDYRLDDIVKKASAEILAAPIVDGRIDLVRTSVNYKFADKQLEALNPVQKQMLRMGPQNTRIIQNKLRLLLEVLASSDD